MSTKGTTDEKLVNLWFGMTIAILTHQKIGCLIWKSSSPSLSIVDGAVVWVLVTVKDSVGVSHGVMRYLHTLSSPKLITGYAVVICYKMAVGSFWAKPAIIFRKMGEYFIEGAGDTGDRR